MDVKLITDWWEDIPVINALSKERTGNPTQKPLALLDRIIVKLCGMKMSRELILEM